MTAKAIQGNLLLTVVLAILAAAIVSAYNRAAAPPLRTITVSDAPPPDVVPVAEAVTSESLRADLERLTAMPTRVPGYPGCDDAAAFIGGELRAAGFDVLYQPVRVTVPVTRFARIEAADGEAFPPFAVKPLYPNGFRTATTPPEGLIGRVLSGELGLAREFDGRDVRGQIVLLPVGVGWQTAAGMGAAAILYHTQQEGAARTGSGWAHHLGIDADVPRFLIEGDIGVLEGRRVRLSARVDFVETTVTNVVGVLPAAGGEREEEMLVLEASYDAFSYAPDAAPGASSACGPSALLAAARLLGRDRDAQRRHVVVLASAGRAQALAGARAFLSTIGARGERAAALTAIEQAAREARDDQEAIEQVRELVDGDALWTLAGEEAERAFWADRPEAVRERFAQYVRRVLSEDMMAAIDRSVAARVAWVRAGSPVLAPGGGRHALFQTFEGARGDVQRVQSLMRTRFALALQMEGAPFEARQVSRRVREAVASSRDRARQRLAEAEAHLALARRLPTAGRMLFLTLDTTVTQPNVAVVCADTRYRPQYSPADSEIVAQLDVAGRALAALDPEAAVRPGVLNLVRENDELGLGFVSAQYGSLRYFGSQAAAWFGHTAFVLTTAGDNRARTGTPFDTLDRLLGEDEQAADLALRRLTASTRTIAVGAMRLARGLGHIVPLKIKPEVHRLRGRVVSRVGDDLTPSQIMPNALVVLSPDSLGGRMLLPPGVHNWLMTTADADGEFAFEQLGPTGLTAQYRWQPRPVSIDAAVVDAVSGGVTWALSDQDSGRDGVFAVVDVPMDTLRRVTITPVLFRAQSMLTVPMVDPASFQSYTGMGIMDARLMAEPAQSRSTMLGGVYVHYVAPDVRVLLTFRRGSPVNPNLTVVRAFALNLLDRDGTAGAPEEAPARAGATLVGPGYLVADHPRMVNIEIDAAASMARVNDRRVAGQARHGMADRLTLAYAETARRLVDLAIEHLSALRIVDAKRVSLESMAYSANIHPVIRGIAGSAIVGILFYLLLAAPFAVFTEKLFVGHPDIRFRLVGQGIIFLLFFMTLRALHPAYDLVRSPLMILLGFVTFGLATGISSFVAGRFKTNVAALRRKLRDEVEVSDVSRSEAVGSAFVLGLGHLRKRAVRTGLTAGTLVLTMFVMLAFTSVRTDIVDVAFPIGRAPYTGLLIRDRNYLPIESATAALQELYGEEHVVSVRRWQGTFAATRGQAVERSRIDITREVEGGVARRAEANGVLGLSPEEPDVTGIASICDAGGRWFASSREPSCLLPRDIADRLDIDAAAVRAGAARVVIGGASYDVIGIFDPRRLERLTDLDGESLVPADVLAMLNPAQQQARTGEASDLPTDVQRLPAESVVIVPYRNMPGAAQTASVAVRLVGLDRPTAHTVITRHLERTGQTAWYGIDDTAYYGGKMRRSALTGLLDMVLPLIVAALAVLNTMRGSVYERRDELYVFNAVGLAPRHIRALFLAEASVYAVIGAVGGYLLAQGLGKLMAALGIVTGLNMSYTSLAVVFVTAILMAVVYLSSLAPARMAARLAVPADSLTRKLETAEGDVIALELPFLFSRRDRLAVMSYFHDWFDNHGEGSAGPFFCDRPRCVLLRTEEGNVEPSLRMTVWLKPYDLGVSQDVDIVTRRDPVAGDIAACVTMRRLTGDVRSWERCCHAFIGLMRQRFLTWRAIDSESRERLLSRSCEMFGGVSPGRPSDEAARKEPATAV